MLIDAGGTVGGVGDLIVLSLPTVTRNVLQGVSGSGDTSGGVGFSWIVSGSAFGYGSLSDPLRVDVSGAVTGAGDTAVIEPSIVWQLTSGEAFGFGDLVEVGVPLPLEGTSSLAAYAEVLHLPPLCPCPPQPYISMRYGQFITKGELPLFLRTTSGARYAPFVVNFTLFQIFPGDVKQRIGPSERTPIMSDVGDFYATGVAGEGGQPGDWVVRWEWQRYQGGPVYSQEYTFYVLDAVLARDPADLTPRKCKYGWEE